MSNWQYDEFKHCGVDYSNTTEAEIYDEQHQKFRDYEKEFKGMLDSLQLANTEDLTVVDLGCGTGSTAILAAKVFDQTGGNIPGQFWHVSLTCGFLQQAER